MQSGIGYGVTHNFTELGDDDLFRFLHDVGTGPDQGEQANHNR